MVNLKQYSTAFTSAAGALTSVSAVFKIVNDPNFSLVDRVIKVGTALYANNVSPVDGFALTFPVAAGEYEMENIGGKNLKAYLIKDVSNQQFTIRYDFFATRDFDGAQPINADAFDVDRVIEDTVLIQASVQFTELLVAQAPINITIAPRCRNQLNFEFYALTREIQTGFIPGRDLQIKITSSEVIDNNFYVGFYKNEAITNAPDIVKGLGLNYAKINSSLTHLFGSCFKEQKPFSFSNGLSTGYVAIDSDFLKSGSTYTFYVVYSLNGKWESCFVDVREVAADVVVTPDVDFSVTDSFSKVINSNCVSALSPDVPIDLCVAINKASYNAKLTELGLTGTYDDYFHSVKAFWADAPGDSSGRSLVFEQVSNSNFCVRSLRSPFQSKKYVVFQVAFKFIDHFDFLNLPFELNYKVVETSAEVDFELEGRVYNVFCENENRVFEFTAPGGIGCGQALVSVNGSEYRPSPIVQGSEVHPGFYNLNDTVCVKVLCSGDVVAPGGGGGSEECDCPQTAVIECNEYLDSSGGLSITFKKTDDIQDLYFEGTYQGPVYSDFTGYQFQFYLEPGQSFEVSKMLMIMKDGCKYLLASYPLWSAPLSPNGNTSSTDSVYELAFDSCDGQTPDSPQTTCSNSAAINYTCNSETGEVTISKTENFTSIIASQEFLASYNGGVTFIPCPSSVIGEENIFVVLRTKFVGGCADLIVSQNISCKYDEFIINNREIEASIVDNEIVINNTDDINSTKLSDKLYVSKDGGVTFTEYDLLDAGYDTPVTVQGNEKVIIKSVTVFEGEPEDLVVTYEFDVVNTFEVSLQFNAGVLGAIVSNCGETIEYAWFIDTGAGFVPFDNGLPSYGPTITPTTSGLYKVVASCGTLSAEAERVVIVDANACPFTASITASGNILTAVTNAVSPTLQWSKTTGSGTVNLGSGSTQEMTGPGLYRVTITANSCTKTAEYMKDAVKEFRLVLNKANGTAFNVYGLDWGATPGDSWLVNINGSEASYTPSAPTASNQWSINGSDQLIVFAPLTNATIEVTNR